MKKLTVEEIQELLQPYLRIPADVDVCEKISRYLDLLVRWNSKISLTAVREPAQIVQRHFGEGLFLAERLPSFQSLLDVGSGAGFPGIPVALLYPGRQITLAESQQKKVSFLKEALWSLDLDAEVWADRVERMPAGRHFDVVALRAVDNMESALLAGIARILPGGTLAFFAGKGTPLLGGKEWKNIEDHDLPLSSGHLVIATAL